MRAGYKKLSDSGGPYPKKLKSKEMEKEARMPDNRRKDEARIIIDSRRRI